MKTLLTHDMQIEDTATKEHDLSIVYGQEGNTQEAFAHMQKSVKLSPYGDNLYNLGNLYEQNGNLPKAQVYYSKALSVMETYYVTADTHNRQEDDLAVYSGLSRVLLLTSTHNWKKW